MFVGLSLDNERANGIGFRRLFREYTRVYPLWNWVNIVNQGAAEGTRVKTRAGAERGRKGVEGWGKEGEGWRTETERETV